MNTTTVRLLVLNKRKEGRANTQTRNVFTQQGARRS